MLGVVGVNYDLSEFKSRLSISEALFMYEVNYYSGKFTPKSHWNGLDVWIRNDSFESLLAIHDFNFGF
jgi:hypothetical protein